MEATKQVFTVAYEGPDLTMEGPRPHKTGEFTTIEGLEHPLRFMRERPNGRVNIRIQTRWVTEWEDCNG